MDLPRPDLLRRIYHALLIPALVVFSIRAGLQIAGDDLSGWPLAVVGILSGAGMALAVMVNWKTPDSWRTVAAVAVALLGHYVVSDFVGPDLGGAMVYLGTGFLVSLKVRWAQFGGMIAGIGALFRSEAEFGQFLLIAGAISIAVAAGLAAFHQQAETDPSSADAKP